MTAALEGHPAPPAPSTPASPTTWYRLAAHSTRIVAIEVARVLPTRLVLPDGTELIRDDPAVRYFLTRREAYEAAYERLRRAAIRIQEETEALEIYEAQQAAGNQPSR